MTKSIKVMFFGDSICVGQYVSIHKGWVTRTSANLAQLGEKHGRTVVVTNSSQNGRTTRMALETMAYEVQSPGADILIVQFGMNDCNYWESDHGLPRVSQRSFAANLHEIIDRALIYGVKRVLLNSNHPTGRNHTTMPYTTRTYQQSNEEYNAIIRQVAAERKDDRITLNEIETTFKKRTGNDPDKLEEMLLPEPDLLHLSEKGHDLYFKIIYPRVEIAVIEILAGEQI